MSENNCADPKKLIVSLMFFAVVAGLLIGIVLGVELYQVVSIKLGFWEGRVEATHIVILTLRHQIQSSSKIRTIITIGNTGEETIYCNATLYYKNALNQPLATHSFNASINAGETHNQNFNTDKRKPMDWNRR